MNGRATSAAELEREEAIEAALALLHLPDYGGLARAQQRGAACVWCAVALAPSTAVRLGARTFSGPYDWFPRGCKSCTAPHALMALHGHAPRCEQCTDDPACCELGRVLRRLSLRRQP